MNFFAPWLLLGLVAATAPVILHLIRRRTAEKVRWGAWMFILETMRKKRRRLQIEELILLILRTLILALAAIAFARPFFPEFKLFGSGMDKDVVLVIDDSASMRLKGVSGRSAFEQAIGEACELVKNTSGNTGFGVVLGERTPSILTPTPISSKREVLDILEKLKPGEDTMDAPRSLAAAGEILGAGNNPAKEVVVFGDGQAYGWRVEDEAEWQRVESVFSRFVRRPPVVWRTFESPKNVKNAAIAGVVPSRRIIGTDRPVTFSVTIVNSGSEAFSPGDAVISVDDREIAKTPVGQILPGLSRTFEFPYQFPTNGPHVLVARLSVPDDIASDSIVSNRIDVISELPVLMVNGRPSEKGFNRPTAFLEAALAPALKGTNLVHLVRPKTVRGAELENPTVFRGMQEVILCDVPFLSAKAMTNLTRYVQRGGGLLAIPGEHSHTELYTNELFAVAMTNWNPRLKNVLIGKAPVSGRLEIPESALTNGYEVLNRFSDGGAAVVAVKRGKGWSATAAFPFDLGWTTYPARPEFVPFAHELVYAIAATNSVSAAADTKWRAREADLNRLTEAERDKLVVHVDLGYARTKDETLAAVLGKSFGIEVWRPFAVTVLVLMILELLFCRKLDRERGGWRKSYYRIVLRTIAFLALLWMLLHISWTHDVTRKIHRRIALFTDRSLSMERADANAAGGTNSTVRLESATNAANRIHSELERKYDVEPFSFGDRKTDFSAALERALERIPSEELAGAVFVTDGRDTSGESPEAAARRFARLGAKISTLVVGSVSNRNDVAIETVEAAEDVFLGDKVRIAAKVRATQMKDKHVIVRLMEGDEELERKEFDVKTDPWSEEVKFVQDPKDKGVKRYRVELEKVDGDVEGANDSWPVTVSVSDDRTNVLIADRRPRWEFRYLRNLFYARDKSVHLQYVLTDGDRIAGMNPPEPPQADATRPFGEAEAGRLPTTRDAWRKFDVIILGDLSGEALSNQQLKDIRYCVEERGALLIAIAGERHLPYEFAKSDLGELLPLSFTNAEGKVTARWNRKTSPFALSPSGAGHPATALSKSASETERTWSSLPPARGRLEGGTLKPGAEILLFAGDTSALKAPLMTVRETGRGKVVLMSTDEMWHLRYRKGDVYHHRFWGNVLKWGTGEKLRDGNVFARGGTDQLHYRPGEPVKILARLSDKDRLPLMDAKPTAEVKFPNGKTSKVDLIKLQGANAYYEAVLDSAVAEGDYEVRIESKAAAETLGDDWPTNLVSRFTVTRGTTPVEYAFLTADETLPKRLAALTGGIVGTADKVEEFKPAFGAGKSEIVEHIEDPIWDHPVALALFALSLILLWINRKRKSLA